MIMSCWICSDK